MYRLAAPISRVSSASSIAGKAACPVCSHAFTSASVARSPKATGSALSGTVARRRFRSRQRDHRLFENGNEAMRQQLGSGLGRDEHVPICIAEILTAGIGAPCGIVVVQLE